MDFPESSMRPLPSDVVAQIKSSTIITHLNGVILELVKNSLDARAQTVTIRVDFHKGGCVVEDDGYGIPPSEFQESGGIGRLHHTSKYDSTSEVYGRKGAFLASLAAMALLTITSRHASYLSVNSLVIHHSKVIARLCPAPMRHELCFRHGTRVTVTDLFGNMPVRVKHRALFLQKPENVDREWDDLKRSMISLLLAFNGRVKLAAFDSDNNLRFLIRGYNHESFPSGPRDSKAIDLDQILGILSRAGYITPNHFGSWVTTSARTSDIAVQSAICLIPSPTKQVQFVSFGIFPLDCTYAPFLYSAINKLFAMSSFGVEDLASDIKHTNRSTELMSSQPNEKRLRRQAKGASKWPMFVVRIELKDSIMGINSDPLGSRNSLQRVLDVVSAMFSQFLEQYHFSGPKPKSNEKHDHIKCPSHSPTPRSQSCIPAIRCSDSLDNKNINLQDAAEDFSTAKVRAPVSSNSSVPQLYFGTWSRVKSGKRDFFEELCSGLPRGRGVTDKQLQLAGNHRANRPLERSRSSSVPTSPPITRDPGFSMAKFSPPAESIERNIVNQSTDEIVRWTNPATKDVVLINKRTGQSLPNKKGSLTLSQSIHQTTVTTPDTPFLGTKQNVKSPKPSPWLDTLLQEWVNPVFPLTEMPVPAATFGYLTNQPGCCDSRNSNHVFSVNSHQAGLSLSSTGFNGRLTKDGLQNAQVISQVDKKFLLVRMTTDRYDNKNFRDILALVDQHAADERYRVEQLFNEMCGSHKSPSVEGIFLAEPISFKIPSHEARLFESLSDYFASWGCLYNVAKEAKGNLYNVQVTKLPTLIAERCRLEPKLVMDMLRSESWAQHEGEKKRSLSRIRAGRSTATWLECIGDCPKGIVDLLNSRACRTAIMFNDELSHDECVDLISRLARCAFPFQCAHGRPTMVPIVNLPSPSADDTDGSLVEFGLGLQNPFAAETGDSLDFMGVFKAWESHLPGN
ncbi:hypothetical protein VTO42DRAFT_6306 [Malbranchea cinnamomea]